MHTPVLLQGDLLVWLLSAAFAHDSTHSQAVLVHARARDELLMATMELRERAMALHLHIPHKFTLNTRREHVDVRASWASVICKVEQVRGGVTQDGHVTGGPEGTQDLDVILPPASCMAALHLPHRASATAQCVTHELLLVRY